MHRHAYQGRKLSRDRDQRKALLRGLVTSLVLHERVKTTEAKAKEIAPYFDRMVTSAKKGDLHHQRQLREFLLTENSVGKMITELAPAFSDRSGGYTRVVKAGNRRGDNAPLAVIELVLPAKLATPAKGTKADSIVKSATTPQKTDASAEKAAESDKS